MHTRRLLPWGSGAWAIAFSITLLAAGPDEASARSRHRRQRKDNECRSSAVVTRAEQERAERYYDSGVIYFDTKDYPRAKQDFQQAYDISKAPDFLVNLAIVAAKLKQYGEAVKLLEGYIAECPNAPDVSAAKLKLDDLRIAEAIQQEGKAKPAEPVHLPPAGALALLGSGAGILIIGAGLGGGALSYSKSVSDPANQGMPWTPSIESKGRSLDTAGLVLDTLGVVAMAAGGVWTGIHYYQRHNSLTLALRPLPGGLLMLGRF